MSHCRSAHHIAACCRRRCPCLVSVHVPHTAAAAAAEAYATIASSIYLYTYILRCSVLLLRLDKMANGVGHNVFHITRRRDTYKFLFAVGY